MQHPAWPTRRLPPGELTRICPILSTIKPSHRILAQRSRINYRLHWPGTKGQMPHPLAGVVPIGAKDMLTSMQNIRSRSCLSATNTLYFVGPARIDLEGRD
jgi:hypothetical protein